MTFTQLPRDAINQDLATIRALSSITSQQADTIAQAVQASGRAWDVQTIDDYDGYLSILIEPSVSDRNRKPSSSRAPHSISSCPRSTMMT